MACNHGYLVGCKICDGLLAPGSVVRIQTHDCGREVDVVGIIRYHYEMIDAYEVNVLVPSENPGDAISMVSWWTLTPDEIYSVLFQSSVAAPQCKKE